MRRQGKGLSVPVGDGRGIPLLDDGRIDIEVAVADPGRPHAPIDEAWPAFASGTIRKMFQIVALDSGRFRLGRNFGNTLVLHRAFVLEADDERRARISYEILMLARLGHGIE